jgi:lipopolysaccharide assembly protein A
MRWFHMAVIVVLVAATLIFATQNFQIVAVSFLSLRINAPLAVLVVVIYLLGMATGGSLWAFVRWALEGSKRPAAP